MVQILEQQLFESDLISIYANPDLRKITYYTDEFSDEIQAMFTRNTRRNQLMKHFTIPKRSLSDTCTHDMKTEPKSTNLIEATKHSF